MPPRGAGVFAPSPSSSHSLSSPGPACSREAGDVPCQHLFCILIFDWQEDCLPFKGFRQQPAGRGGQGVTAPEASGDKRSRNMFIGRSETSGPTRRGTQEHLHKALIGDGHFPSLAALDPSPSMGPRKRFPHFTAWPEVVKLGSQDSLGTLISAGCTVASSGPKYTNAQDTACALCPLPPLPSPV